MSKTRERWAGGVAIITKTKIRYACNHCDTEYKKESDARACFKRPVEGKKFKKGNRVSSRRGFLCNHQRGMDKTFVMNNGVVVKILPLRPVDPDYSARELRGQLRNTHAHEYEVRFRCWCGKKRGFVFYSVELGPPESRKRNTRKK